MVNLNGMIVTLSMIKKKFNSSLSIMVCVMNNKRRKSLESIKERINHIISEIEAVKSDLDDVDFEEQNAFDNLSEGLQQTMRGMNMEDAIDSMDEASDNLNSAIDNLNDIV